MKIYWGPDKPLRLTDDQFEKLWFLLPDAMAIEQNYDAICKAALESSYLYADWKESTEVGYYIKLFYKTFFTPEEDVGSNTIPIKMIDSLKQVVWDSLEPFVDDGTIDEIGLNALKKEIEQNIGNQNWDYAKGNYAELRVLEGLARGLSTIEGWKIQLKDTSPKNFGESIKYDIKFTMDFPNNPDVGFDLPIEVKKGVQSDFTKSKYHFGSFSDTGMTLNRDIYKDLIKALQDTFKDFIQNGNAIDINNINEAVQKILVSWAIEYIAWRLKAAQFPIFVSDNKKSVNLSSEVIRGFCNNPGGYLDIIIKDLINFVGITNQLSSNSRNVYSSAQEDWGHRLLQRYNDKTWTKVGSYINHYKNLDDLFDKITVMPQFEAHVWYGKY